MKHNIVLLKLENLISVRIKNYNRNDNYIPIQNISVNG